LDASSAGLNLTQAQLIAAPSSQNDAGFQIAHRTAFPARKFETLIRAQVASPKR
jgi:hypothetical protein